MGTTAPGGGPRLAEGDAARAAIDLGGDTDTVAAVTGALAGAVAGAVAGITTIPDRWTAPLHVPLPGFGERVLRTPELTGLAARLRT